MRNGSVKKTNHIEQLKLERERRRRRRREPHKPRRWGIGEDVSLRDSLRWELLRLEREREREIEKESLASRLRHRYFYSSNKHAQREREREREILKWKIEMFFFFLRINIEMCRMVKLVATHLVILWVTLILTLTRSHMMLMQIELVKS